MVDLDTRRKKQGKSSCTREKHGYEQTNTLQYNLKQYYVVDAFVQISKD